MTDRHYGDYRGTLTHDKSGNALLSFVMRAARASTSPVPPIPSLLVLVLVAVVLAPLALTLDTLGVSDSDLAAFDLSACTGEMDLARDDEMELPSFDSLPVSRFFLLPSSASMAALSAARCASFASFRIRSMSSSVRGRVGVAAVGEALDDGLAAGTGGLPDGFASVGGGFTVAAAAAADVGLFDTAVGVTLITAGVDGGDAAVAGGDFTATVFICCCEGGWD